MTYYIPRDVAIPDGVTLRVMEPSDENFVFSSFIHAQWSRCQLLSHKLTTRQAHETLEHVLQNLLRKATVVLLCDASELDAICAYIIFERKQKQVCVHFVYNKEAYRGLGYSETLWRFATRGLGKDDTIFISSFSPRARNILDAKKVPYHYRPFMLFASNTFSCQEDQKRENAQEKHQRVTARETDNPT